MASSTSDVEMFLDVLSPGKKIDFIDKLKKAYESYECVLTVPTKVLGRSITFLKVQELMGNTFELPITGGLWKAFKNLFFIFLYLCTFVMWWYPCGEICEPCCAVICHLIN